MKGNDQSMTATAGGGELSMHLHVAIAIISGVMLSIASSANS
jgi:hypothetical protein